MRLLGAQCCPRAPMAPSLESGIPPPNAPTLASQGQANPGACLSRPRAARVLATPGRAPRLAARAQGEKARTPGASGAPRARAVAEWIAHSLREGRPSLREDKHAACIAARASLVGYFDGDPRTHGSRCSGTRFRPSVDKHRVPAVSARSRGERAHRRPSGVRDSRKLFAPSSPTGGRRAGSHALERSLSGIQGTCGR